MTVVTHPHVEPLPIPLIQEKYNGKSDNDIFLIKLRGDPTLSTSDLYEFKISLFDNGESEEFLLFVRNINTTLVASGTLEEGENIQ